MSSTTTLNDPHTGPDDMKRHKHGVELPPKMSEPKPTPPPMARRTSSSSKPSRTDPPPSSAARLSSPARDKAPESYGDKTKSPLPSEPSAAPDAKAPTEDPVASIIDMETFSQILEMDDDPDDREFSRSIIWNYFEQAAVTFDDMDKALTNRELSKLSSLGHFLKGSSAALGVSKVQASCERMQHYGQLRDDERGVDLSEEEALKNIKTLVERLKKEYAEAERWLKDYFGGDDA